MWQKAKIYLWWFYALAGLLGLVFGTVAALRGGQAIMLIIAGAVVLIHGTRWLHAHYHREATGVEGKEEKYV